MKKSDPRKPWLAKQLAEAKKDRDSSKTLRQQLAEARSEVDRLRKMARTPREPLETALGGVIQEIRESQSMALQDLARRSGVSAGLLSRFESHPDANPTFNNLVKVAKALGKTLAEIIDLWERKQS
jgi:ribosome-binding protein aMBF1 (putative translation factor)